MDSPVRKMLKKNDYNRHKLLRKIKRLREAEKELEQHAAEKELRKKLRRLDKKPKFDRGKNNGTIYELDNPDQARLNPETGEWQVLNEYGQPIENHGGYMLPTVEVTPLNNPDLAGQYTNNVAQLTQGENLSAGQKLWQPVKNYFNELSWRLQHPEEGPISGKYTMPAIAATPLAMYFGSTAGGATLADALSVNAARSLTGSIWKDALLKMGGSMIAGEGINELISNTTPYESWGKGIETLTGGYIPEFLGEFSNPGYVAGMGNRATYEAFKPFESLYNNIKNTHNRLFGLNKPKIPTDIPSQTPTSVVQEEESLVRQNIPDVKEINSKKLLQPGQYSIDDFVDKEGNINIKNTILALRQFRDLYNVDLKTNSHTHQRNVNGLSEPFLSTLRHLWNSAKTAQTQPVAEGSSKLRLVFNALVHDIGEFINRENHPEVGADVVKNFINDLLEGQYRAIKSHMDRSMLGLDPETQALHFSDVASGLDYDTHVKNATYANYKKQNPISNISYDRDKEPVRDVLKNKINPVLKSYGMDVIDLNLSELEARQLLLQRIKEFKSVTRGVRDPRLSSYIRTQKDKDKLQRLIDTVKKEYNIPQDLDLPKDVMEEYLATYISPEASGHGDAGWPAMKLATQSSGKVYGPLYTSNSYDVANGYASRVGDDTLSGNIYKANLPIIDDPKMSLTDLWLANDFPLYDSPNSYKVLSDFFNYEMPYRLKTGRSLKKDVELEYDLQIKNLLHSRLERLYERERVHDDRYYDDPIEYIDPETGERSTKAYMNPYSEYQEYLDKTNEVNYIIEKYIPGTSKINSEFNGAIHNRSALDGLAMTLRNIDSFNKRITDYSFPTKFNELRKLLGDMYIHLGSNRDLKILESKIIKEFNELTNVKMSQNLHHLDFALFKEEPPLPFGPITPSENTIPYVKEHSEKEISDILYKYFLDIEKRKVKPAKIGKDGNIIDTARYEKSSIRRKANSIAKNLKGYFENHDFIENKYSYLGFSDEFIESIKNDVQNIIKNRVRYAKNKYFENIESKKKTIKDSYFQDKNKILSAIISKKGTEFLQKHGVQPSYLTDDIQKNPVIFTTERLRSNVSKAQRSKSLKLYNKEYGYLHYIIVGKRGLRVLENPTKVSDEYTKANSGGSRSHLGRPSSGLSKKVRSLIPPFLIGDYYLTNKNNKNK